MLEKLIVATLVVAAVVFSAWRLTPLRRRLRLLERLAPEASRRRGPIGALWRATQAQAGQGCNACVNGDANPTQMSAGPRR